VIDELELMCKEVDMGSSRYILSVCPKWLSKAVKYINQDGRSPPIYKHIECYSYTGLLREILSHAAHVCGTHTHTHTHSLQKLFSLLLLQCIHLYTINVRDLSFSAVVFCVLLC
jgi:hypothetical protein